MMYVLQSCMWRVLLLGRQLGTWSCWLQTSSCSSPTRPSLQHQVEVDSSRNVSQFLNRSYRKPSMTVSRLQNISEHCHDNQCLDFKEHIKCLYTILYHYKPGWMLSSGTLTSVRAFTTTEAGDSPLAPSDVMAGAGLRIPCCSSSFCCFCCDDADCISFSDCFGACLK